VASLSHPTLRQLATCELPRPGLKRRDTKRMMLIPTSSARKLTRGPPEFPCAISASVAIRSELSVPRVGTMQTTDDAESRALLAVKGIANCQHKIADLQIVGLI
jgi:hypothetical protein